MKVIVNGAAGHMGRELCALLEGGYRGAELYAAVDAFAPTEQILPSLDAVEGRGDVVIDFSSHAATPALVAYAKKTNTPLVIATTGHSEEEMALIRSAAETVPIFFSANMSLGVALLVELARQTVAMFPEADVEIIETHHNRKADAPSGTALLLANGIREVRENAAFVYGRGGQHKRAPEEIGIHAVRMGNVVGEHEVRVGTDTQTITLKHQAHSRALFAEGAVAAACYLMTRPAGLYCMQDMLHGEDA